MKRHRFIIEPLEWSVNGYTHVVKRITTVTGSKYRTNTGNQYFRSETAARAYIKKMADQFNAWKVFTDKRTGKELFAYTCEGSFQGEEEATKNLLCFLKGIEETDIDVYIELRE